MDLGLDGKLALVTGSTAGIGLAAARALAEEGARVTVNGFEPKPFPEISDADWLRFFETNVLSGIRLSRHYLPGMREKDWGRIVFVSSESAVQIPVEMIHYGMTKTAQIAEVASMIVYVCSARASATTGAALRWTAAWCAPSFESEWLHHSALRERAWREPT